MPTVIHLTHIPLKVQILLKNICGTHELSFLSLKDGDYEVRYDFRKEGSLYYKVVSSIRKLGEKK